MDTVQLTNTKLEGDDDCLLIGGHGVHEMDEFVTEENSKQSTPPQHSEQAYYSLKEFENDDDNNVALGSDADHLVDEDTTEYIFEPANESSQDAQDQLITEDSSSAYAIDQHYQYYDVSDDMDDSKFMTPAEPSDMNEEIDNTSRKSEKRKRRAVNERPKADDKIYNCQYCDNVYHDKAKYAMHIKMHNQIKPHECE